jgi:hypothetical protein
MSDIANRQHSFSVADIDDDAGATREYMADYGLTVIGGNWPFVPIPYTDSVNVPHRAGGYTYVGESMPDTFVLQCALHVEDASPTLSDLFALFDEVFALMPTNQKKRIYLDGVDDRYWIGLRVSGVHGVPVGNQALIPFDIVFQLDSPEAVVVGES